MNARCDRHSVTYALLLIMALLTTRADAFEYLEHRDVSNKGFARARAFIEQKYAACSAACCVKELRSFDGESLFSTKSITFGDLVALVDYVTDPNDFLFRRGFDPADPRVGLNFLNEDLIRKLKTNAFQALHAAHNDRNHFQDRALSSFWTWHRVARQVASTSGGGDLRLALVYSAFSIHFLEDFFAPGHIRTPRSSLHDAAAMNIHDRFNRQGQCFILDKDHLAEIAPPFLNSAAFADLQAKGALFLRGDGSLGHPKDDNRLQSTFLAALVGRAVADVFESYLNGQAGDAGSACQIPVLNHFDEWKWGPYEVATEKATETCSGKPPSHPLVDWLGIAKTVSPLACIRYGCYDRVTDTLPLGVTTVLAIDAGPQALLGADATSRAQGELSVGPIILLWPSKEWRDGKGTIGIAPGGAVQLFGGLEWNHVFARGYSADGLRARTYLPLTSVDLQLTASGTYRWYRGSAGDVGRWSWDGGVQFGFGLVFTGLSVGRQHAVDETDGRLKPAWVLTGNLTLMVSPSIVTKIGNDHEVTFDKRE